jgi:hypothetical protein
VREGERDRASAEHHQRERRVGAVEPVGAEDAQADLVVERLGAALVDPEPDRLEDPVVVAAERAATRPNGSRWLRVAC